MWGEGSEGVVGREGEWGRMMSGERMMGDEGSKMGGEGGGKK